MNSRSISVVVGLVLVVAVGFLVYTNKRAPVIPIENVEQTNPTPTPATTTTVTPTPIPTPTPNPTPNPTPSPTPQVSGISMSQVAMHNTRSSCWAVINGNVYDLTSWIPNHPGGEAAILSLCGKDGSAKFNGQHGTATKPNAVLVGFKLGVLAN